MDTNSACTKAASPSLWNNMINHWSAWVWPRSPIPKVPVNLRCSSSQIASCNVPADEIVGSYQLANVYAIVKIWPKHEFAFCEPSFCVSYVIVLSILVHRYECCRQTPKYRDELGTNQIKAKIITWKHHSVAVKEQLAPICRHEFGPKGYGLWWPGNTRLCILWSNLFFAIPWTLIPRNTLCIYLRSIFCVDPRRFFNPR